MLCFYVTQQIITVKQPISERHLWVTFITALLKQCTSLLWRCWLGGKKGIWPVKKLSGGVLVWFSVWSQIQTCIRSSWCQCHSRWPVKTEWWGAGVVVCLEQGADLHMAQLMPLSLNVSCFSKIQIGFTFLVAAHQGSPRQGPLNGWACTSMTLKGCERYQLL